MNGEMLKNGLEREKVPEDKMKRTTNQFAALSFDSERNIQTNYRDNDERLQLEIATALSVSIV